MPRPGPKWDASERFFVRSQFLYGKSDAEIARLLPGRTAKAVKHCRQKMSLTLGQRELEARWRESGRRLGRSNAPSRLSAEESRRMVLAAARAA